MCLDMQNSQFFSCDVQLIQIFSHKIFYKMVVKHVREEPIPSETDILFDIIFVKSPQQSKK